MFLSNDHLLVWYFIVFSAFESTEYVSVAKFFEYEAYVKKATIRI